MGIKSNGKTNFATGPDPRMGFGYVARDSNPRDLPAKDWSVAPNSGYSISMQELGATIGQNAGFNSGYREDPAAGLLSGFGIRKMAGLGAFPPQYAADGGALLAAYAADAQSFVSNMQYELNHVPSRNLMNVPADVMAGWLSGLRSIVAQISARDDLSWTGDPDTNEISTSKEQMISAMNNAIQAMLDSANGNPPGGPIKGLFGGLAAYPVSFDQVQGFLGGVSTLSAQLQARAREADFTAPVPVSDYTPEELAQINQGNAQWQTKITEDKKQATSAMCSPLAIFTGEIGVVQYVKNCMNLPWYVKLGIVAVGGYGAYRVGKKVGVI